MKKCLFVLFYLFSSISTAFASTLNVVAAENFYGDVATQLGQPYAHVRSIISNPNQDPHLFSVSPKVAVLLNQADIIIENGLGYDTWMDRLYTANASKAVLINVGQLLKKREGDNPHIWYDPKTMIIFSKGLVEQFIQKDPEHVKHYEENLRRFLEIAKSYQSGVARLSSKVSGEKVTATEPVANYLLQALKLDILNKKFQQDMMNEVDLTPKEIIAFEESLISKDGAKLLVYNTQVSSPVTERLKNIAESHHVSTVGVSETMPNNLSYYQWMNQTLQAIAKGLA